jgi:hypothetical protein
MYNSGTSSNLIAATPYQGIHDKNQKLWNIGSYVGAAGMLLHVNGKFTMGKFKIIIKLF